MKTSLFTHLFLAEPLVLQLADAFVGPEPPLVGRQSDAFHQRRQVVHERQKAAGRVPTRLRRDLGQ